MTEPQYVHVVNMTNFFNRELYMYSLGDIKFRKPVSLKKVAYTTAFLILWTVPVIVFLGLQFNFLFAVLAFAPPIILGNLAAKPVWGGRGLIDYLKTTVNYIKEPKGWTDLNANNLLDRTVYFTESEIWISRRRELQMLADMKEREDLASGNVTFRNKKRKK
mgnify:FL=1